MGYWARIAYEPETSAWAVQLKVRLSRAESNRLFLSGDSMISWPVEGLLPSGEAGLARSAMFVSEVAARPLGFSIRYQNRLQAEQAAVRVRRQLDEVGITEET